MSLLTAAGLVLLGLVLLLIGGEGLVRGACGLALIARISPTVTGLTVVAAGTSAPELVVSLNAALRGSTDLAVGNVVGSNIFNVAAILGIAAMIGALKVEGNTVKLEWPVMMLASFQFFLLARDGLIDRLEGGFFVACLVAFMAYVVWAALRTASKREQEEYEGMVTATFGAEGSRAIANNVVAVLVGAGLLVGGSRALVSGAVTIAEAMHVSQAIIGLTVLSVGTSLPELAASAVASWRGNGDIAVANVVGSNIFNILGIAGATALLHPLPVPGEIMGRDIWWMLGLSLLLFPLMRSRLTVSRAEGGVLFAAFSAYMVALFLNA